MSKSTRYPTPVLNENTFSHYLIEFFKGYILLEGVSRDEIDAWADDLYELSASGDYSFSSNEYIMVGIKP